MAKMNRERAVREKRALKAEKKAEKAAAKLSAANGDLTTANGKAPPDEADEAAPADT